jgi:glycosyltransferase involved in cell wall biosynthesis
MSTAPVVSVVMPVRNGAGYLSSARSQVEALVGPELEILVVDDASDDETPEVLAAWAADDPRVRILRQESRQGVAAGRNRAVRESRGAWLWFTDCDDEWSPHIVERMLEVAVQRSSQVVVCQADSRREDGGPGDELPETLGTVELDGDGAIHMLLQGHIRGHLWNKLFDRRLFDDVQFPATWAHSDLGAMGDLLVRATRVTLIDDVLYTYILRPQSIIGSGSGRPRDLLDVLERIEGATSLMTNRTGIDDELASFAYHEVYLPTLHRQIRRGAGSDDDIAVRREIRRRVTLRSTRSVVRGGRPLTALAAVSASYAHPIHARAYRAFRRVKWGAEQGGAA